MPKNTQVTARDLRIQETRLNTEITTCNLALDRLEIAGIDKPDRSISDPFTLLEKEIYNFISARLDTALKRRRVVHQQMRQLGIEPRPAAVDNCR